MRKTEIRSLEIDFDNEILKINGEKVMDRPVIAVLPALDNYSIKKIFNPEIRTRDAKECDRLEIRYIEN